jgi:hypothetical protein
MAVPVRLAVSFRPAGKVMSLDYAGKAFALGDSTDFDFVPFLKQANINPVAYLDTLDVIHPELPEIPELLQPFEVSPLRRVEPLAFAKAKLNRIVAFFGRGLDLGDGARPSLDGGYRFRFTIVPEYLGHAQLPTDDSLKHFPLPFIT